MGLKPGIGLAVALAAVWVFGERGRLLRGSTWQFMREMGWRRVFNGDFLHAYVYGRWSNQYIGWSIKYWFPRLRAANGNRRWADVYHGKLLTTKQAEALITINEPIPRQDLEQIIPYETAREIVLSGSPDVAVYECPCRSAREHPCQPTDVCMIVGQPFVDFLVEHNPHTARKITRDEALAILRAEHARGHVHAAYFKDVMLNRFYAICNCCACCCGGLEAMRRGVPMVASSGYVAQVDADQCQACGTCEQACPFDAIRVNGTAHVVWESCMGCGVCAGQCPEGAIVLLADERKGQPLDVHALAKRAHA